MAQNIFMALALMLLAPSCGFEVWIDRRCGRAAPAAASSPAGLFDREITPNTLQVAASLHISPDGKIINAQEALVGAAVSVSSSDAQQKALALVGSVEWIFIEASGQQMITAENIIAAAQGTGTRLAVRCSRASDVNGLAFALQVGVDALVIPAEALDGCDGDGGEAGEASEGGVALLEALQIAKAQRLEILGPAPPFASDASSAAADPRVELVEATITSITSGGVGDRVALDLTRLLHEGEGCLLGSSAKRLALVLGETAASGFVPPRPFRVNAGPVHQYVLLADGSTKYLSEVTAGDAVLAVRASDGAGRPCVVGRCKVEPRPMLKVTFCADGAAGGGRRGGGERRGGEAEAEAKEVVVEEEEEAICGQLFLQQAETVRLASVATPSDGAGPAEHAGLPVTEAEEAAAQQGVRILVRLAEHGTHVGRTIKAKVTER